MEVALGLKVRPKLDSVSETDIDIWKMFRQRVIVGMQWMHDIANFGRGGFPWKVSCW